MRGIRMNPKAIALLPGGLDSTLAVKLILCPMSLQFNFR
jgi:7-cyano-7-deazaguanine synthase in queuosine biosynthesis